jgi:HAMP domain-containing protein
MRRMIKEMLDDVETVDKNNNVCEELYTKLEQKVRKKFNEEVERLEKSFRRIIEQLEI